MTFFDARKDSWVTCELTQHLIARLMSHRLYRQNR
jgi:hypothetical protein